MDGQIDRRGGRSVAYVDRAYEPITVATVDDAAKFDIDFVPQYQKLTLHRVELRRDGKWQNRLDPDKVSLARRESGFEENMADGSVTALIVLEDIRPRDVDYHAEQHIGSRWKVLKVIEEEKARSGDAPRSAAASTSDQSIFSSDAYSAITAKGSEK